MDGSSQWCRMYSILFLVESAATLATVAKMQTSTVRREPVAQTSAKTSGIVTDAVEVIILLYVEGIYCCCTRSSVKFYGNKSVKAQPNRTKSYRATWVQV